MRLHQAAAATTLLLTLLQCSKSDANINLAAESSAKEVEFAPLEGLDATMGGLMTKPLSVKSDYDGDNARVNKVNRRRSLFQYQYTPEAIPIPASGTTGEWSSSTAVNVNPNGETTSSSTTSNNNNNIYTNSIDVNNARAINSPPPPEGSNVGSTSTISTVFVNEIETTFLGGSGQCGNMFDMKALEDITIVDMDIHILNTLETVEVYWTDSTYAGKETQPNQWQQICIANVQGMGFEQRTPLPANSLTHHVSMQKGEINAFYVTVNRSKMAYTFPSNLQVGAVYSSNVHCELYLGVGKAYPFGFTFVPRLWNGAIRYTAKSVNSPGSSTTISQPSAPSAGSISAPSSVVVGGGGPTNNNSTYYDELTTTYEADSGQAGNMFDVVALKDVVIHEMDLHVVENPASKVSVYTREGTYEGHEQNDKVWTQRASVIVEGRGVHMATPLPAGALDLVEIQAGTTCAFYVTLDVPEMRYSSGSGTAGNLFAFNDDLQILEGVGNVHPFGATFFNRVWNGSLRYTKTESHLATTYGGGSGQSGVMFDVQALQNIILQTFDLHIASEEEQILKIYSKEGTFVGSESSDENWQLMSDDITILGMGEGLKSPIPSNAFIPISLTTGTRRAFYITIQNTVLVYSGGTQLGNVYAENVDLKIMEGSGNAYLFGAHFTPRVFNGVIRYTKPHMRHISTDFFESNSGQAGIMFDIIAKRDMAMHGMEVNVYVNTNANQNNATTSALQEKDSDVDVAVWYREGSHVGYEHDSRDWTQLCHVSIEVNKSSQLNGISKETQLIALPPNSFAPVSVTSGTRIAFYVTSNEPILRYNAVTHLENEEEEDQEEEEEAGETFANSDLILFDGTGVEYPFGKAFRPRKWNGVLRYTVANIPSNVVNREMVTTFLGGSGQSGIMFDIIAKRDVSIYSLDLHIVSNSSPADDNEEGGNSNNNNKEQFQIFVRSGSHVGFEKDADAWQLLGSASVRPQHRRTPLPINAFEPIVIGKGDTEGLYVTLTSNHMRYSGGNKVGNVYLANDDIMVLEGTGITFPFGETYSPRVFNGAVRYTVLDE